MSRVLTVGAAQMGPIQLADARPEEVAVPYTHLRAPETREDIVCRLLLAKKTNLPYNMSSFSY